MRNRRHLALAVLALLLAACASTGSRVAGSARAPVDVIRGTLALIEPDIELTEVNAGGAQQPRADWTLTARSLLPEALRANLAHAEVTIAPFDLPDDDASTARVRQLTQLQRAVGISILRHGYGVGALPSKHGAFDWTLGPGARELQRVTGADYALFVTIRDSYSSSGRAAMMVVGALVGVGLSGGVQVGFASLVDLRDGRVVWFNRLVDHSGDLRDAEGAATTARLLLKDMPL